MSIVEKAVDRLGSAQKARDERKSPSTQIEKSAPSITFHVIDPPTVSSSPVRPNRVLLATLAFFLAIACGVAPAIFRSSAEPVFYSSSKLERQYGVPVLGTITWRRSPAEIVQARMSGGVFSICVLGEACCFEQTWRSNSQ